MHSKTFFCNGWQLGKQTELGWFTVDAFAINHLNTNYIHRKFANSSLSWLVPPDTCPKAKLLLLKLIHLFAREVSSVNIFEMEETKTT